MPIGVVRAVRVAVARSLSIPLDDVVLVRRWRIPKTTSGGAQRRAAPALPARELERMDPAGALAALSCRAAMDACERALEVLASVSGSDRASLRPELDLVADLGLDSTQALRLLVELEDALGFEIDDEDVAHVSTVGDVLAFVQALAGRAR